VKNLFGAGKIAGAIVVGDGVSFCTLITVVMLHLLIAESLLSRYLNAHAFTELHLDSIFKYGDDNTLPLEVNRVFLNFCTYIAYIGFIFSFAVKVFFSKP